MAAVPTKRRRVEKRGKAADPSNVPRRLTMQGVLNGGFTDEAFQRDFWGKKIWAGRCTEDAMEMLKEGFGEGDMEQVLPMCRKDDNSTYTPEQMRDLESSYEEGRKTLNFPLCFTEGAQQLRNAFLTTFRDCGNDVEVGVYFSRPGGETAPLHSDNNHNITIQVSGQKEWTCCEGNPNTTTSRAYLEPPRNGYEQATRSAVKPDTPNLKTYLLNPGSVIYLPPGHWHAVKSVGSENSFSIDLRVGNVLKSKLLCEMMYSGLLQHFNEKGSFECSLEPGDFNGFGNLEGMMAVQMKHVVQNMAICMHQTRLPRTVIPRAELSDGLQRGCRVEDVLSQIPKQFQSGLLKQSDSCTVRLNPLVATSMKTADSDYVILCLLAESAISSMEYLRMSLYAPMNIYPFVQSITQHRVLDISQGERDHPHMWNLLRALEYLNVISVESVE
eukprot:TRINITY_DN1937_c0_g5_i1.p1 TRINITY_DN1937_c0_g5~~TRINITY_DN1937_c0_g5_i1.p1  ORF type:complete len:489 (+),score=151.30 TRINITY_DN1937_c0_g5_i1:142-1467(+)